jgi:peptide deformylase
MEIITNPNDALRQKAKKIKNDELETKQFTKLLDDMAKTMLEKDGIGLAAPQVGISKRIIIINTKDGPMAMINPRISKKSWRKDTEEEGCLSVPGIYGNVKRHSTIKLKLTTPKGKDLEIEAKGLFARVIQHEIDHLDGILFIDKAKKIKDSRKQNM